MLSPGLKQTTHNTSQRTVKQSERLPILRRKMRCLPTLQHTTNPYGLRGDTQLKLSHPANHVRMPCQHGTHLNILRQGPRHLPDNKSIIQTPSTSSLQSTGHHQSNRPNFSTKITNRLRFKKCRKLRQYSASPPPLPREYFDHFSSTTQD